MVTSFQSAGIDDSPVGASPVGLGSAASDAVALVVGSGFPDVDPQLAVVSIAVKVSAANACVREVLMAGNSRGIQPIGLAGHATVLCTLRAGPSGHSRQSFGRY